MSFSLNATPYNPADWYWEVSEYPNEVWSSARLDYVSPDDEDFQRWCTEPTNQTTKIPNGAALSDVMLAQRVPTIVAPGVQVNYTTNSALNAVYPLDFASMATVGAIARDAASGLGFPGGLGTYSYSDITGTPHDFTVSEFTAFYRVTRDYISAVQTAVSDRSMHGGTALPDPVVTV